MMISAASVLLGILGFFVYFKRKPIPAPAGWILIATVLAVQSLSVLAALPLPWSVAVSVGNIIAVVTHALISMDRVKVRLAVAFPAMLVCIMAVAGVWWLLSDSFYWMCHLFAFNAYTAISNRMCRGLNDDIEVFAEHRRKRRAAKEGVLVH
jgi:hypothetical protein